MTVQELITELKEMPPNSEVYAVSDIANVVFSITWVTTRYGKKVVYLEE